MKKPCIRAVVVAGGASRQLDSTDPHLPAGHGSLLARIVREVCASPVDGVAVVLGAAADQWARSLAGQSVTLLRNPEWSEGLASAIRVASSWAERTGATGLLLCQCDHVGLETAHLTRLIAMHHATCRGLVASAYRGMPGLPALFPRRLFPALFALSGDRGARTVIRSQPDAVAIEWPASEVDIETPADLGAWQHGG